MAAEKKRDAPESIVWKQFKKRPIGLIALTVIMILFAVAVYAPLLANHQPLALKTVHPQLYANYYAGWTTVHDIVVEALKEHKEEAKVLADAKSKYEKERLTLRELTDEYNKAGDDYDAARGALSEARNRIEQIGDILDGRAEPERGKSLEALKAERKSIEDKLPSLQAAQREAGARKAKVKREIDEHRAAQEDYNRTILAIEFRQNYRDHARSIRINLDKLRFPVDAVIGEKIEAVKRGYASLFKRIEASGPDEYSAIAVEFEKLIAEAKGELSPEKVRPHLVYRWTFPALAALDGIDRGFMLGYLGLLVVIFLGRRLPGTLTRRLFGVVVLAVVGSLLLGLLNAHLPPRRYKRIFVDNVRNGYTESLAVVAPIPYGYNENRVEEKLQRPRLVADVLGRRSLHWFGTDDYGRDVLSRMIWGARVSLSVGFVAVTLYVTIGIIVGALAGFFGGKIDIFLSRFIEIVICFPSFFLILAVIAFIGPSIYNIMIVIGLTSWTGIARLTRGEFLRLRNQEYVLAARASGISLPSIMFRHVLPNAMTPVLVAAAFGFAGSILIEAGLSFLGFGVQEPFPSWGQMLSDSQSNPLLYWWMFILPGSALFITVTFYNLAGNTFRDASDPRLRQ